MQIQGYERVRALLSVGATGPKGQLSTLCAFLKKATMADNTLRCVHTISNPFVFNHIHMHVPSP